MSNPKKRKSTPKPLWYFYVIRTMDNFLYAGVTTDVDRRYSQHASGVKGAKYLSAHKPAGIVMSKTIGTRSMAQKVEYRFKQLDKKQKELIVKNGTLDLDNFIA